MISAYAIFIHIPRCAGTSIETVFQNIVGHHEGWWWYACHLPDHWFNPAVHRFAFVRDPFDRLESLWAYWNNVSRAQWFGVLDQRQDIKDNQQAKFQALIPCFDTMLESIPILRTMPWTDRHFATQQSFLGDPSIETYNLSNGEVTSLWPEICERTRLPRRTPLPRLNRSPKPSIHWTPRQRAIASEHFAPDLAFAV